MSCPNCNEAVDVLPGNVLVICRHCGYVVEAAPYGIRVGNEPLYDTPDNRFAFAVEKLGQLIDFLLKPL